MSITHSAAESLQIGDHEVYNVLRIPTLLHYHTKKEGKKIVRRTDRRGLQQRGRAFSGVRRLLDRRAASAQPIANLEDDESRCSDCVLLKWASFRKISVLNM